MAHCDAVGAGAIHPIRGDPAQLQIELGSIDTARRVDGKHQFQINGFLCRDRGGQRQRQK